MSILNSNLSITEDVPNAENSDEICRQPVEAEDPEDDSNLATKSSNLVQYVKPTHGYALITFRDLVEQKQQIDFKKLISSYGMNFVDTKYLTLLRTQADEVLNHIKQIGEIVFICVDAVVVKTDDIIFLFTFNSDHMSDIHVSAYSSSFEKARAGILYAQEKFKGILAKEKVNMELRWYYYTEQEVRHTYITEELNDEFYYEAYPYLDLDEIINSYLDSEEPILILIGPPGTGKTRLIRHILRKKHERTGSVNVAFTSDQNVIENSQIFVDYLLGDADTLIIEDIDYHLRPRGEGNTAAMYNFLTASNSILVNHVRKKKMIFSTNLSDSKNIDEALLRPGRCFKIIETRPLSLGEAQRFMKIIKKEGDLPAKPFTIAEIYNSKTNCTVKKIGF